MKDKQYGERDIEELDVTGEYYTRHVCAMTKEGLHSKSDIAAELAVRDFHLDMLKSALTEAQEREKVLREALQEIYDNAQFEIMCCQKCGYDEPMKDCDYVSIAAKALGHET